jgi:hypothetical protein
VVCSILEVAGITREALDAVPADIRHEALHAILIRADPLGQRLRAARENARAIPARSELPAMGSRALRALIDRAGLSHADVHDKAALRDLARAAIDQLAQCGSPSAALSSPAPTSDATTDDFARVGAKPAKLVAGEAVLKQRLAGTMIEKFDFSRHSMRATLSLGVQDRVQMREADEDDTAVTTGEDDEIVRCMDEIISGRCSALLNAVPRMFEPTVECVVCLGTQVEGPPDAVLYQCGHKCTHLVCATKLRRCPLCRALIAAVLPAS